MFLQALLDEALEFKITKYKNVNLKKLNKNIIKTFPIFCPKATPTLFFMRLNTRIAISGN